MTTPPIEPPEPPGSSGPFPPPEPPADATPDAGPPPRRYETRTLVIAAVVTVAVISLLTLLNPVIGLLAPLTLIVALFFIRKDAAPHRRSIVTGIILGSGIALLTTAGICTSIFNSTSSV